MRAIGVCLVLVLVAALMMGAQPSLKPATVLAAPQAATEAMKTFSSSAEITELIAKAKADHKPGQVVTAERILSLAPYNVNLEYRPVDGAAALHEKEAEMVYVIDGTGTLITGGNIIEEKRTNDANLTGTGIAGGKSQPLAKGDFAFIPENTPHQFTGVKGVLVLMTFHVPRTASAGK
jgi:mannose-6-phosphate isomerase-like protein (cupin superfamily)